ncbi:MAG: hypothetical protein MPN21_10200 [Thermoanaerobaculia bacterium]|nr:hypothetical protein [Thermoanaerobaculia bacterium]
MESAILDRYRKVPAIHTEMSAEVAAITEGCGIFDRDFCDRLILSGEDRARFLHGQVTCAVKDLAPGEGTYGFLATLKGRVEVELVVLATENELWLDLPPGTLDQVRTRLAKYVIADRIEFVVPETTTLTLIGPGTFDLVAEISGQPTDQLPTESWHHRTAEIAGEPVRIVREPSGSAATGGAGGMSIWRPKGRGPRVDQEIQSAGGVRVGWRAFERLRVEQGRPLWGVDFGDDTFPQETGLEDAVDYAKGCYLGQEVIARIHYRGGVQRHMRRLSLSALVEPGLDLFAEDRQVGRVTSVAGSSAGETLGLGVVHQRAAVGTTLEVRDGEKTLATATIAPI